jgi:hypothetical protein
LGRSLMATTARTGAGQKRKASSKATDNTELEALKKDRRDGRVAKSRKQPHPHVRIAHGSLYNDSLTVGLHFRGQNTMGIEDDVVAYSD